MFTLFAKGGDKLVFNENGDLFETSLTEQTRNFNYNELIDVLVTPNKTILTFKFDETFLGVDNKYNIIQMSPKINITFCGYKFSRYSAYKRITLPIYKYDQEGFINSFLKEFNF